RPLRERRRIAPEQPYYRGEWHVRLRRRIRPSGRSEPARRNRRQGALTGTYGRRAASTTLRKAFGHAERSRSAKYWCTGFRCREATRTTVLSNCRDRECVRLHRRRICRRDTNPGG